MNVSRVSTLFALTIALAGCGGGSGSGGGSSSDGGTTGGSKPAAKTPAQIIADAKSFTTSQLNTAARTLADNGYNGSESKAGLDIALAQQVYRMMFDDNLLVVPEITEQLNASELAEDGSIDTTLDCERGGSVSYNGQFQHSGIGKVTLKFDNCISFYDDFATSGVAAISIDSLDDATSYSVYFNPRSA
ncbi:hypothetical protein CA267_008260 [Alteromonas pelagimontana]|uniref:Lipoprotein n=1 Tax=Alteromonas pelagimontana TaxID=1858656 RepID=A0A6M4MDS5_9ALTE|nr:hypothetical protein [Alteromonas pelagimontana]QJR80770.1 hypothetical protein CA267_008260 [Alteromonas pelagimontana]